MVDVVSGSSPHSRSDAIGEKWEHAIISDELAAEAFLELARDLEEQLEALRGALEIIATTTYPARYLGVDERGRKMYGGSDDASRFAREILNRVSSPASESLS